MDIYTHGVGSSCQGNEYHHEVAHMVEGGVTLCGVVIQGRHWYRETWFRESEFVPDKAYSRPHYGEKVICQRCAKARAKRLSR